MEISRRCGQGEELGVRPRRRRPARLNSRFQTNARIELYLRPKSGSVLKNAVRQVRPPFDRGVMWCT